MIGCGQTITDGATSDNHSEEDGAGPVMEGYWP